MKPDKINILGKEYIITYCDNPSDVDLYHRESLWGQIDYWTQTIRIYDNKRAPESMLQSILHEILHGIHDELKLNCFDGNSGHEALALIAMALADMLNRNEWLKE